MKTPPRLIRYAVLGFALPFALFPIVLVALLLLTGCATTRLSVTTPDGVTVKASLPKNMDATDLALTFDPVKQVYTFRTARLITDASTVVDAKNKGVAAVSSAVSDVAKTAAPLLLP